MKAKTNLSTWLVMSIFLLAMVGTTANSYCFFGEFTVDGNNSQDNRLRISGLPTPCNVRITYSSGYFTNGGPMPGWGAYAGDCVTLTGTSGQIGCPFSACYGPAGGYYYDLNQLLSCLTNLPPFEFSLEQGDWIEVHVWDDPGAGCNTATRRCGSMSFTVDVWLRAIYYVDADATGANNGTSWADAYNYLQDALALVWSGDEIWVAQGIYTPDSNSAVPNGNSDRTVTFQLINGVTIKGGYAGFGEPDPNARDVSVYETVLSGDLNGDDEPNFVNNGENSYHVVTGSGTDATAVLDGFIITGGNANGSYPHNGGGGMYNDSSRATVSNCTFIENSAGIYGGGMYNKSGRVTVSHCMFSGNSAGQYGGGMSNTSGSSPRVTNCTFSGNTAEQSGGGLYNMHSSPMLTNCTFNGNSAWRDGGGMYNYGGSPTVTNCILWGDTPEEIYVNPLSMPVITYSDVEGGWLGTGNIDADPCFVEPGYWDANDVWIDGDYHLLLDSPCINTGNPYYIADPNETDLDGKPRVIGGRIDMGAYEFNHIPVADAGPDQTVCARPNGIAEVTLDGTASYDDDGHPLSYLWRWTVDGQTRTATGPGPTIELPVGEQTIELIVNDGIDDSEADEVVITVIEPIEVAMKFTPQALNPGSKGNWVKAHFVLPAGFTIEDVDANSPANVEPLGIESEYINVFVNQDGLVEIEIAFGRAAFCGAATDYGPVEVTVIGLLTSGQYFYGTDTIKIINKTFEYLGVLASHWLEAGCGAPDWCGGVDLDHSSMIDFVDFAMFDGCCIEVIRQ